MPSVTVKNIPEDIYEKLKKRAHENRRSINNEIIMCIERTVKSHRINPDEFLAEVRKLRESIHVSSPDDDFLRKAKEQGRP